MKGMLRLTLFGDVFTDISLINHGDELANLN